MLLYRPFNLPLKLTLILTSLCWMPKANAELRINEFVANTANNGLLDEDGVPSDWIELYNTSNLNKSTAGLYLTDDPTDLTKWPLPDTVVNPNDYLVIFASSKNRTDPANTLHTNFKLSADGEYLALTKDAGIDSVEILSEFTPAFPEQIEGFSYGIDANALDFKYFATPTPSATNSIGYTSLVADSTFSINRGFYTEPISVSIESATIDATIYYTTDGSEPSEDYGTLYSTPLTISTTTTLRAAAFKDGLRSERINTQTYLFLDDVSTQYDDGSTPIGWPTDAETGQRMDYTMDPEITERYTTDEMVQALSAIPSISIVTDQSSLTSPTTGIYVNAHNRGSLWERAASVEFLHPNDSASNMQAECGLRIRGGASRHALNAKHSFRLYFRSEYGDAKLEFPLFETEGADTFDKVDLRTAQNYSWSNALNSTSHAAYNTFLREVLGRDLQGALEQPYTRSRYYHLYLNGVYWGLFMTQERPEASYGETYFGGTPEDYDTVKSSGSQGDYTTEAADGSITEGASDWWTLWDMMQTQDTTPSLANFMAMQGYNADGTPNPALPVYLDNNNLIDYMLCIGYTGNFDAPLSNFVNASNNWYGLRNATADDRGFAYFIHDGEHTFGAGGALKRGKHNRMKTTNGDDTRDVYERSNPQYYHQILTETDAEYRLRFADRAHATLFNEGVFTVNQVLSKLQARQATVDQVIIAESARWGDAQDGQKWDKEDWDAAVVFLTDVILDRTAIFLDHLRDADLYPELDAPIFSQHGGHVSPGTQLSITAPAGATHVYYHFGTDTSSINDWIDPLDPRLLGGAVAPTASVLSVVDANPILLPDAINEPGVLKARSYNSTSNEWSALNAALFTTAPSANSSNLRISELHYHPLPPTADELLIDPNFNQNDFEFIEITNISDETIDIGGVRLIQTYVEQSLEGVLTELPNTHLMATAERLLIVANPLAFTIRYPTIPGSQIIADYSGRMDNDGDTITLQAVDGSVIETLRYSDLAPWPASADGFGQSLTRIHPNETNDTANPESWRASVTWHGSPTATDHTTYLGDSDNELINYILPNGSTLNISSMSGDGNHMIVTADLNQGADGVILELQKSVDLLHWESESVSTLGDIDPQSPQTRNWQIDTTDDTRVFVRLFIRLRD